MLPWRGSAFNERSARRSAKILSWPWGNAITKWILVGQNVSKHVKTCHLLCQCSTIYPRCQDLWLIPLVSFKLPCGKTALIFPCFTSAEHMKLAQNGARDGQISVLTFWHVLTALVNFVLPMAHKKSIKWITRVQKALIDPSRKAQGIIRIISGTGPTPNFRALPNDSRVRRMATLLRKQPQRRGLLGWRFADCPRLPTWNYFTVWVSHVTNLKLLLTRRAWKDILSTARSQWPPLAATPAILIQLPWT